MFTHFLVFYLPVLNINQVVYGRYIKKLSNKTQDALGSMSNVAQECLSAVRTVQAHNATPFENGKFATQVDNVFQLAKKEAIATAMFYGGTGFTGNVTILCLLGYGGTLVSRGAISVGDLTSLLMYSAYVGSSMGMLS